MRISDWSSDVCSSDLLDAALGAGSRASWTARLRAAGVPCGSVRDVREVLADPHLAERHMIETLLHPSIGAMQVIGSPLTLRSEERRVGKECVSTCRARRSP